jgi:excisionase family DNA binding protein
MKSFDEQLRELVYEIVNERMASLPRPKTETTVDTETQAIVRQLQIVSNKPYLNKQELALYLDCSERSIEEWSQRPADKNPLPVVRAGRDVRIKREKVDEWMVREDQRYWRLKNLKVS